MTKKNKNIQKESKEVMVDGMMTFGELDNKLIKADFMTYEHVEINPFIGRFKVQAMRNGCVFMEQLTKRIRNHPLFRLIHSSMSYGRNGKYYYVLSAPDSEVEHIPDWLEQEAHEAAERLREMIKKDIRSKRG